jgi:hypothetical protein
MRGPRSYSLFSTRTPWIQTRDNSPRSHQAPARPDKEIRNFLWDVGFASVSRHLRLGT